MIVDWKMRRRLWFAAQLLAASELATGYVVSSANAFEFNVMSAFIALAPVVSLIGLIGHHYIAFWGVFVWPAIAFLVGVGPIPFLERIVHSEDARWILITTLDIASAASAFWIYKKLRTKPVIGG